MLSCAEEFDGKIVQTFATGVYTPQPIILGRLSKRLHPLIGIPYFPTFSKRMRNHT